MYLPADILLAKRYLKPHKTFLSIISILSVLGPLLGVAVLIIVTSIMSGFGHDIRKNMMNMDAHLTVLNYGGRPFQEPLSVVKKLEAEVPGLKATPVIEASGLIQLRDAVYPKVLRGIDPKREPAVSTIFQNLLPPSQNFTLKEGQALVGGRLASQLNLSIGDEFLIHSPSRLTKSIKWNPDGTVEVSKNDEVYLPEKVKMASCYSMGVSDYDDNIIIMHIDQAAELIGLDWGSATCIKAVVPDPMNIATLTPFLRTKFPEYYIEDWQQKNQLLFNTLQSEKNLMSFLMTFIVLVASFAIAATLITVAVKKTRDIGIMRAIGISKWMIARVFLFQGIIIGFLGTLLGTGVGLLVVHYRNAISKFLSMVMGVDVFPAELYHLTSIPALTTAADLIRIIVTALTICIFAALVPAIFAASFSPAEALRSDN